MSTPMTITIAKDMLQEDKPSFAVRNTLIDAMATLPNSWWKDIRIYRDATNWGRSFYTNYVKSEWDHFDVMVTAVSEGKRDENQKPDTVAAKKDAEFLHKIVGTWSRGKDWVKDEHDVRDIFIYRSFEQIREIYFEYVKLYQTYLDHDIEKHLFEDLLVKDAILAIIRVQMNSPHYFAGRLYETMHGSGTNEANLDRIIITRSEIDMQAIKLVFNSRYSMSLASMIEDDTSGDYMKLLKAIIE